MAGAGTSTANQVKNQSQQEAGNSASTTTGATAGTQQQTGTTQSGPWSATQPLLSSIIGSLGGLSATPNPAQSEAVAGLQSSAGAIPNFGNEGTGAVNDFLGGKFTGMLGDSLAGFKNNVSPFLSSSYLNPMSTPGLSDALGTMKNDVTNSIDGRFAAAGRDLSPANSTALARGLTQGMAPIITGQYNTNVGVQRDAQNALLGAGQNNVGMLSGLDQTGVNMAGAIPGLYTGPAAARLGAANTAYSMPYNNLGMLSGLALPIAGLGQTGSTTGTGTTAGTTSGNTTGNFSGTGSGTSNVNSSNTMSPLQMLSSLFGSGGSAAGMGNAAGQGLGMLAGLF